MAADDLRKVPDVGHAFFAETYRTSKSNFCAKHEKSIVEEQNLAKNLAVSELSVEDGAQVHWKCTDLGTTQKP